MENYFATNLKYLREKNNLLQEDLAKKIGVELGAISHWENKRREPKMDMIIKIANLFNVGEEIISKDLRLFENEKLINKPVLSETEKFNLLKDILKDKGMLDEKDEMSEEDFNRLIDFAKRNKDFIIKDKK